MGLGLGTYWTIFSSMAFTRKWLICNFYSGFWCLINPFVTPVNGGRTLPRPRRPIPRHGVRWTIKSGGGAGGRNRQKVGFIITKIKTIHIFPKIWGGAAAPPPCPPPRQRTPCPSVILVFSSGTLRRYLGAPLLSLVLRNPALGVVDERRKPMASRRLSSAPLLAYIGICFRGPRRLWVVDRSFVLYAIR